MSVVATDHDFVNLHVARRYVLPPQTTCLCLDSELPLPFPAGFLSAVLCMDGLHYVRSKQALLRELDRIVQNDGLWLFPHMHNALSRNVCPGVPLSAEHYRRCFSFLPSRLLHEQHVLDRFMRDQELDLNTIAHAEGGRPNAFSLVASRRPDLWRVHDDLSRHLTNPKARLAVNPIYRVRPNGAAVRLTMSWPTPVLESECKIVTRYLPTECELPLTFWNRLQSGTLTREDGRTIDPLIKSFVLVPLPEMYA
jgi:hypothetical protein